MEDRVLTLLKLFKVAAMLWLLWECAVMKVFKKGLRLTLYLWMCVLVLAGISWMLYQYVGAPMVLVFALVFVALLGFGIALYEQYCV